VKFEEDRTDTKSHPLLGIGELEFNLMSMEGFMNKILRSHDPRFWMSRGSSYLEVEKDPSYPVYPVVMDIFC
jgi:hypothetical protein